MKFSDIIGYQEIKQRLTQLLIGGRVPQAQLFLGTEGTPILPFGLSWATYLLCKQRGKADACGVCASCQKAAKHIHPDLYFVYPIGNVTKTKAMKKSPVAATLPFWRSFLGHPYHSLQGWATHLGSNAKQLTITTGQIEDTTAFLHTHALESDYKVVVIYLPEHMSVSAANKLLKTLEEPADHLVYILLSHAPDSILPTVSSRTSRLTIPPFNDSEMVQTLQQKYPSIPLEKLKQVVSISRGNFLMACELATEETDHFFEPFAAWMRSMYANQYSTMIDTAEKFAKSVPSQQKALILYALHLMNVTMMRQQDIEQEGLSYAVYDTFCQKFGHTLSFEQLERIVDELEKMCFKLGRNAHPKLLFLSTSLAIGKIMNS